MIWLTWRQFRAQAAAVAAIALAFALVLAATGRRLADRYGWRREQARRRGYPQLHPP